MTQLPEDLLIAYQNFTLLATKHGFAYAGFMMRHEPTALVAIGNVTQNGHELVKLLRDYADILEGKTDKGQLEPSPFRNPN